jgi:hypothetical protein
VAITNGYCELDDLKDRLSITDFEDDATLEQVITAVSRQIDALTGRRFYATTDDETRYYTPELDDVLFVDDIQSITTLQTDDDGDRTYENTWTTDDYDLLPDNAALDGRPYTRLELAPYGDFMFPEGVRRGVKIVGKFGFSATGSHPDVVREACLLQSARIFKRKDAPFGITGAPEFGVLQAIPKLDPDVVLMLESVKRLI